MKHKFNYLPKVCHFTDELEVIEAPLPDSYARTGYFYFRKEIKKGEASRKRICYCNVSNGVITWYHCDYRNDSVSFSGDILPLRYTPLEIKSLMVLYNRENTRRMLKPYIIKLIELHNFYEQLREIPRKFRLWDIKESKLREMESLPLSQALNIQIGDKIRYRGDTELVLVTSIEHKTHGIKNDPEDYCFVNNKEYWDYESIVEIIKPE